MGQWNKDEEDEIVRLNREKRGITARWAKVMRLLTHIIPGNSSTQTIVSRFYLCAGNFERYSQDIDFLEEK